MWEDLNKHNKELMRETKYRQIKIERMDGGRSDIHINVVTCIQDKSFPATSSVSDIIYKRHRDAHLLNRHVIPSKRGFGEWWETGVFVRCDDGHKPLTTALLCLLITPWSKLCAHLGGENNCNCPPTGRQTVVCFIRLERWRWQSVEERQVQQRAKSSSSDGILNIFPSTWCWESDLVFLWWMCWAQPKKKEKVVVKVQVCVESRARWMRGRCV